MDLDGLRVFISLVDSGSFVGASRALRMPRATLRRRLEELEARTGVTLVERLPGGVVPTAAGAALLSGATTLVRESEALLNRVREAHGEDTGPLRLLLPPGLPAAANLMGYAAVRRLRPKLPIAVRYSDDPLNERLDESDLIVFFGDEPPQGPWLSHTLAQLRLGLLAAPEYLASRGTPRTVEELLGHELMVWSQPGSDPCIVPLRSGGHVHAVPSTTSADVNLLRQLASAGLGIALVPDAGTPLPGDPTGSLCAILEDVVGRDLQVRLIVHAALAELPRVGALIRALSTLGTLR